MNQWPRTTTHISCVAFVLLLGLPACAYAGLYKCVDEKTKAVTYSGTPCPSGDVRTLSITENAIMDGAAAQQEIARRQMEVNQTSQGSVGCNVSPTASQTAREAEDRYRTVNNSSRSSKRDVRDAKADMLAAQAMNDHPCNPEIAQQIMADKAASNAADKARRQEAHQRMQLDEANRKLDEIQLKLNQ